MRESELLSHIYRNFPSSAGALGAVEVGPGDDCAVLHLPDKPEARLLATTDQLVEGRHYDASTTPQDLIARKAVARSVSDVAAMGGRPLAALANATLRGGYADPSGLFDAMSLWATRWECPLVGGDIAFHEGPSVLSVIVLGTPHPQRGPVLRRGAGPGDGVYVTGRLGGSLKSGRHLSFEPRVTQAQWLCDSLGDRLRAMIDISDGLGRDAGRVASASGVRIVLEGESLPRHDGVEDWREAMSQGEDYELCFCVEGEAPGMTPDGVEITRVGVVEDGEGCVVRTPAGDVLDARELGWDHSS